MRCNEWLTAVWPKEEAIPFSQFMELCLYHPQHGYYEQDAPLIGPKGDFITSVSATPLFGQLLAFQLASWLEMLPSDSLRLVEAGAHDGTLAKDILDWLTQHRPGLLSRVEYLILEPSARRRQIQQTRLEIFAGRVRWVSHFGQLEETAGAIFSNELLDAFPVRRLGWDQNRGEWFEWGVANEGGVLSWRRLPLDGEEAFALLRDEGVEWSANLGAVLPDGYTLDLCPAAGRWWRHAAACLGAGWLMTIDYGLVAEELLVPHRITGTARAYGAHHQFGDLLSEPGRRDLTAHVNFTQLTRSGEACGLVTEGLWTQERFFLQVARNYAGESILAGRARAWQSLAHPERTSFRVLVQRRA